MLATTVPKGIKLEVFVRVDNVVVIKLQDNCKFWNYKIVVLPLPPLGGLTTILTTTIVVYTPAYT